MLALASLPLAASSATTGDNVTVDGINYQITSEKTAKVMPNKPADSWWSEYVGDVVIPASITVGGKTYTVNEIGKEALSYTGWDCNSITLPNTIERLDSLAMSNTKIKKFVLPGSVKVLEYQALANTSIEELTLNEGLETLGTDALARNNDLKALRLPASLKTMAPGALHFCHWLEAIEVAPDNQWWTSVDGVVYSKDKTVLFDFPCNKKTEGTYQIDYACEKIEKYACSYLDRQVSFTFNYKPLYISEEGFNNSSTVQEYVNTSRVSYIGKYAFGNNVKLKSFEFGYNLEVVDSAAFYNAGLEELKFSYQCVLKRINSLALGGTKLTKVMLPETLEYLDPTAFRNSHSLEAINVAFANKVYASIDGVVYRKDLSEVVMMPEAFPHETFTAPSTVRRIADCAFYGTNIRLISLPEETESFGYYAFAGSSLLKFTIPPLVSVLPEGCFQGVPLTSLDVPATVKELDVATFYGSALESITFADGITEFPERLFFNCQKLTDITMPSTLKSVGYGAFGQCYALETIAFPDACESVAPSAFECSWTPYNHGKLANVTFGKSMKSVGGRAFLGQLEITKVRSEAMVPPVLEVDEDDNSPFQKVVYENAVLEVNADVADAYRAADQWNRFQNVTTFEVPVVTTPAQLYLVGRVSGWMEPSETNSDKYADWKLAETEEGSGVYTGEFTFTAAAENGFRFYSSLDGWDNSSIGASQADVLNPVEFASDSFAGAIVIGGKGSWQLPADFAGKVMMTVDLNAATIVLEAEPEDSLDNVGAEAAEPEYYTLDGCRVAEPQPGSVVICRRGSSVSKIIVR